MSLLFDSRYETDANMAHQLINVALRVLIARKAISTQLGKDVEITVILREGASAMSVSLYEQLGIPTFLTDGEVVGDVVCVSDEEIGYRVGHAVLPGGTKSSLSLGAEIFLEIPLLDQVDENYPERLFIARKGARRLVNDQAVSAFLEARGFVTHYFEDIPVGRQMRLCRHARVILSIHGAALAHMLFNNCVRPPGSANGLRIIELFGAGYSVDLYRRLAALQNAHWCGVRGQLSQDVIRDLDVKGRARSHQATPFAIDLESLEMALNHSELDSRQGQTASFWRHLSPSE
jgi:hypothetical protein